MKKAKKLGLQSLALVLMAFVLVAGVAFGMTGAWFTDVEKSATTNVNFGTINIKVTDTVPLGVYRSGTILSGEDVMPGDHIKATLAVAKDANTDEDFFYVVKITATIDGVAIDNLSNAWRGKTASTAFASNESLDAIDLTLDGTKYGNTYQGKPVVLSYEVRAIQATNQDASSAWTNLTTTALQWDATGSRADTGIPTPAPAVDPGT